MTVSSSRRIVEYALAGLLLVVPALFLRSNLRRPEHVSAVDRAVLAISAPLQRGVAWVIDGLGAVWNRYVWLVAVEEDNAELRGENERLRRELAKAARAAAETAELEQLVQLTASVPADTVGARVVAQGMTSSFRVTRVTLDRGEGVVRSGMPVLASEGVVGRIQRTYGRYADVMLAVDPQSAIDVVIPRTRGRGVLKGDGGANGYSCRIDYLLRNEAVKEGDLVVTSGIGGVFPRDVPVGRIKKVKAAEYGLYQEVEVEPVVDFLRLAKVLVILAPPPPPDPTAKQKKAPEPAFGAFPYK